MTRFFAFGCSFFNCGWPTTPDFIGVNFDEYYNAAEQGSCNTYIMNKFIQADHKFHFNPETDFVLIGLSGFGRFSFYNKSKNVWDCNGDLIYFSYTQQANKIKDKGSFPPDDTTVDSKLNFIENLWCSTWAVESSWVAVNAMKSILEAKGIKHRFISSIDNSHYMEHYKLFDLDKNSFRKVLEIRAALNVKESILEFQKKDSFGPHPFYIKENFENSHPNSACHYKFVEKYMPDLLSDKSKEMLDYIQATWNRDSIANETQCFDNLRKTHLTSFKRHI